MANQTAQRKTLKILVKRLLIKKYKNLNIFICLSQKVLPVHHLQCQFVGFTSASRRTFHRISWRKLCLINVRESLTKDLKNTQNKGPFSTGKVVFLKSLKLVCLHVMLPEYAIESLYLKLYWGKMLLTKYPACKGLYKPTFKSKTDLFQD